MDEQQRGRIRDDLKGFFKGELLFDELARALYSTDASIFQVQPAGVAVPRLRLVRDFLRGLDPGQQPA